MGIDPELALLRLRAEKSDERINELLVRVQQLERGLSFYADPDTWFAVWVQGDRPCGQGADDISLIEEHNGFEFDRFVPGRLAREILAGNVDAEPIDYYDRNTWTDEYREAMDSS